MAKSRKPQTVTLSKETMDLLTPAFVGISQQLKLQTRTLRAIAKFQGDAQAKQVQQAQLDQSKVKAVNTESDKEKTTIRGGVSRGTQSAIGSMGAGLGIFAKLAGAGVGIAAVGVGIGGFFAGLAAADSAISKLGDGKATATLMTNLGEGLESLSSKNMKQIGGMLAVGALWGTFAGVKRSGKAVVGMGAIGLGIGGFMTGMAAAGELTGFDGSTFKAQAKNISEGLDAFGGLKETTLTGLVGLMGAGGLLAAAPGGVALAGKAAVGMSMIGLGIGGFMTGMVAAGDVSGFTGANFKTQATNISAGLNAFDPTVLKGLSGMMAVGGIFGAIPGGLALAGAAALGMSAIGFGIGGFITGLATAGEIGGIFGVNGEGIKTIMVNTAQGLQEFDKVDGKNFKELGDGMIGLGPGLLALMGAKGLGGLTDTFANAFTRIKDFFTGEKTESSPMQRMVDSLEPLNGLDLTTINALDSEKFKTTMLNLSAGLNAFSTSTMLAGLKGLGTKIFNFLSGDKNPFDKMLEIGKNADELNVAASGLERIAKAMESFGNIKISTKNVDFHAMALNLAATIPILEGLTQGGDKFDGWFDGKKKIEFGEGLINNSKIDLNGLVGASGKVAQIVGMNNQTKNISDVAVGDMLATQPGRGGTGANYNVAAPVTQNNSQQTIMRQQSLSISGRPGNLSGNMGF